MYNEKIEGLIKAALADGVLTEKEKQVLFKRAQEQGIDLDEFEMVLDARLVELEKEEKEKAEKSAPKSNKFGDVRKCPACGALIPALTGACTQCGYEFTGIEASSSAQLLAKKLEEIQEDYNKKINEAKEQEGTSIEDVQWGINKQKILALSQAIKNFTIPNTKADLFEFITAMQAQMTSKYISKLEGEAYVTKYKEAIIKSKLLCANDPMFAGIISEYENVLAEYKKVRGKQKAYVLKPSTKFFIWFMVVSIGILIFCGIMSNV